MLNARVLNSSFCPLLALFAVQGLWQPAHSQVTYPYAYHTYAELVTDLQSLVAAHSPLASLHNLGVSHEGRTIWAVKVSDNVELSEGEPVVYIEGGIHGGEWIATEVAFHTLRHLLQNYATDPVIQNRVDSSEIWFIPMLNPDGHVRTESLAFNNDNLALGRKNGRVNGDGTIGVNVNRNFDYFWASAGSTVTSDKDYRGPSAWSEPEALIARNLIETKLPRAMILYHSFHVLNYYSDSTGNATLQSKMLTMATNMNSLQSAVYGQNYAPTGANHYGLEGGWGASLGIPSITVELRPNNKDLLGKLRGGFALPETQIEPTFLENIPAALYVIDYAITGVL